MTIVGFVWSLGVAVGVTVGVGVIVGVAVGVGVIVGVGVGVRVAVGVTVTVGVGVAVAPPPQKSTDRYAPGVLANSTSSVVTGVRTTRRAKPATF
jgi:hypothetical protein